jgi:hypothetical protein
MTFEERSGVLTATYQVTPRQARFLTLVALISGYCLRRQYGQFAHVALGKNPGAFLDDLVRRGLAARDRQRLHRSFVYHVKHRALYEALGMGNNRNRRPGLAPRQARQIMLLDFAIAQHDATWYATEADKVELFASLGVARTDLPGRLYRSTHGSEATQRQFVLKSPIYLLQGDSTIHFLYLSLDTTGQGLGAFLTEHAPLLRALPSWHLAVAFPSYLRSALPTWHSTIHHAHLLTAPALTNLEAVDLHAYFRVQHALTHGSTGDGVTIDQNYERRRKRFAGSPHQGLFDHWRANGGPQLPPDTPPDFSRWRPAGKVTSYELPFSYDLFGSFPGIA